MGANITVAFLAALLAGGISGLSGFGYALVSVPLLLMVYDPPTVIAVLSVVGMFTSALVVSDSFRSVEARAVGSLLPWSALGLFVGIGILRVVEAVYIELAAGILVVVFSMMLLRELALPGLEGKWGPAIAGASAGAMATSTGLGGPPIVMLFAARKLARDAFRATNAAYLLILGAMTFSLLLASGMIEWRHIAISALLIPAASLGKAVGTRAASRLSGRSFRKISLGITLAAGFAGILGATPELLAKFL